MAALSVTVAVNKRISTRAFLRDRAPSEDEVRRLLSLGTRAPSGGNTQPWHMYVVAGDARDALCKAGRHALTSGDAGNERPDYAIYPPNSASEAYMRRRRTLAADMYARMGVDRKDKAARAAAMLENFDFFGAPVGIIVTVDRIVDKNGWGHVGCLLQSVCLLAEEAGMATCLQEAWSTVSGAVRRELDIPDSEIVWCGIAVGYADGSRPVNSLRSERESLDAVASFRGFAAKARL